MENRNGLMAIVTGPGTSDRQEVDTAFQGHPSEADLTTGEVSALHWGIKESFRIYIAGVEGVIEQTGVERAEDGFCFPLSDREGATFHFSGSVRMKAHGGLLDVHIESPALRFLPDMVELSIAPVGQEPVVVATGDPVGPILGAVIPMRLQTSATFLFDHTYSAGTELDPVRLEGR